MRADSTPERLLRHIKSLAEPRNPLKHSLAWETTQDYLTDQLREMGREVLEININRTTRLNNCGANPAMARGIHHDP